MIEQINFWLDILFVLVVIGLFVFIPALLIRRKLKERDVDITDATDEDLENVFEDILNNKK